MKFYENLNPVERKKIVLRAVEVDSYMEGMTVAREECAQELRKLDRGEVSSTLLEPTAQKAG